MTAPVDQDRAGHEASREQRTLAHASAAARREMGLQRRDLLLSVGTPVVLLILWEITAQQGLIDARFFPPPSRIFGRGADMIAEGTLVGDLSATIYRLVIGTVSGAVVGIVVGLLMGTSRALNAALGPIFSALYALPKIAVLPLLLLIFGLTETPKILSVAISVFFVMQINTVAGVHQIEPRTLEAARAYGALGLKRFRHVILPAALPYILSGLRVSAGMAVIVVTAVEFVASNTGLGFLIWNSWQLFQPEQMYVGLIVVSLLGALVTGLIVAAERLALPWKYARAPKRARATRPADT